MEFINKTLKNWLWVDTRSLALFRIMIGFLGLCDVLRRFPLIDVFYSDKGLNFNTTVANRYTLSLLDYFHTTGQVQFFFIVTAICFFFLMIGYRTRIFQILAVMGLISIHAAEWILQNGGDMVIRNYMFWALFLPLGTSWSIDSIRQSIRKHPEHDTNDLNKPMEVASPRIFHLAYLACLVQLAMIYFFNYINKTGAMWSDGSAIHYMYQLDTFLTPLGTWLASILNTDMMKFLTQMTRYIEIFAPIAILSPLFQPWLRRIMFVIFMIFHLIIGISINIGLFSWVMMTVLILLLGSQEIDLLKSMISKWWKRKYIVFYDRDCGFCHLTARILKRMDGFSRLKWADRLLEGNRPEKLDKLLETTIVVWDPETNQIWTRHRGFERIISAIPLGFLFSWIFILPGLEKLFGMIYDWISRNRTFVSKTLGVPACGIPREESPQSIVGEKNIILMRFRKFSWVLSNILVMVFLLGAMDSSMRVNKGFKTFSSMEKGIEKKRKSLMDKGIKSPPEREKKKEILSYQRRKLRKILRYPKISQNWNMFSPSVIRTEKWVIADLTFENGETMILFQNDDDVENNFNQAYFQPYKFQFWRKLFSRISEKKYQQHISKFKNWLKNTDYFSEYEGRKVKEVMLWQLSETTQGPENNKKSNVRKKELKRTQKRDGKRIKKVGFK